MEKILDKKKLLTMISAAIFIFLIIIIYLFFYFRYKSNSNLAQSNQNSQIFEQIIKQSNAQDIDEQIHKNTNKNLNTESLKQSVYMLKSNISESKPLDIDIKNLVYNKEYCDKLKVKVEIEYPVILNKNHDKFIDKINQENKAEAEKNFNECKSYLIESAESMLESSNSTSIVLYYNEKIKVTRNDNIVSIKIKGEWYAGGIRDIIAKSKNYDLTNSKKLTLADILNSNKKNINKMISEKVTEYFKSYNKENFTKYNTYFEKHFENYNLRDYKFHIENKNSKDFLVIDFSRGDTGAGCHGAPSIEIPISEIKQKYKIGLKI